MSSLIAYLNAVFAPDSRVNAAERDAIAGGVAHRLLEGADARVGHDPHQAAELRAAASAYLRVVR